MHIGVRVEFPVGLIKKDLFKIIKLYNNNLKYKIYDPYVNGKIILEKQKNMLIARGAQGEKTTGNINFSLMIPIKNDINNVERVIQIVNVLGNDKLIKERVQTFYKKDSVLNNLPELSELTDAFKEIEQLIPGFINGSWYYAPEANFDE